MIIIFLKSIVGLENLGQEFVVLLQILAWSLTAQNHFDLVSHELLGNLAVGFGENWLVLLVGEEAVLVEGNSVDGLSEEPFKQVFFGHVGLEVQDARYLDGVFGKPLDAEVLLPNLEEVSFVGDDRYLENELGADDNVGAEVIEHFGEVVD